LIPIYGPEIELERPYEATLRDGLWLVKGRLPAGAAGGVFDIRIRKADGAILYVDHGR